MTWQRTKPATSTLGASAEMRGNFQALDSSLIGKNPLGDPTFLCWPGGDAMDPGDQWGHWN